MRSSIVGGGKFRVLWARLLKNLRAPRIPQTKYLKNQLSDTKEKSIIKEIRER